MATMTMNSAANGIQDLPVYHQPPETTQDLDWADLATLDLSLFDQPGGKKRLAKQLCDAIQTIGFFYIINFGISQERINRQFALAKKMFDLPYDEKIQYRADLEHGHFKGYKPKGFYEAKPGQKDNFEMFDIPPFNPECQIPMPDLVMKTHRQEIETFSREMHEGVAWKILRLCALALELPEDLFLQYNAYDQKSESALRYLKYHAHNRDELKFGDTMLRGHTDFGTLTLLFRQPVAALQVKNGPNGDWKWVKPYTDSITVNLADSLDMVTNGLLKSSIHRVTSPPDDQAHFDRIGVLYMVRSCDSWVLDPVDSPVVKRMGLKEKPGVRGLTAGDWVKAKVAYVSTQRTAVAGEVEIVNGVKTRYY